MQSRLECSGFSTCQVKPLQISLYRLTLTIALAIFIGGIDSRVFAQTEIKLDTLPKAPENLSSLIRRGRVTFVQGTQLINSNTVVDREQLRQLPSELLHSLRLQQSQTKASDDTPIPRSISGLAAITAYRIEFRFSRQRYWDWDASAGELTIQMRAKLKSWQPIHTIWFRQPPELETCWENRLMQHEFDHVRLSVDDSMRQRFASLLREGDRKVYQLSPNQTPSDQLADELTDQWIHQTFGEIVKLIDVRYRELDRITSHGLQSLPGDSSLRGVLRPDG